MTRVLAALLKRARREFQQDHVVSTDTMMQLAAEGYELSALEDHLVSST